MAFTLRSLLISEIVIALLSGVHARSVRDVILIRGDARDSEYAEPNLQTLVEYPLDNLRVVPDEESALTPNAKRSWTVPSGLKRKTFWSPLGHLPASARLGPTPVFQAGGEDSGSQGFRYG
ncbi:hypothetical protein C0Q70_17955 [Pomacea canaliculata]|uniref:Uncharacterized protein n=1 Tax=Pomacea canaliculata TaxID=400727 RepID=A0A2T7NLV8_POMCA|nr:hypothetical protein C0Q70_17955 [Pomacea canaliculata]